MEVRKWLINPREGGLPRKNVFTITSSKPHPGNGAPTRDQIQQVFLDLAERAEKGRTGLGAQLGKRLYVYASGHGFSPTLNQACLHAGDASSLTTGSNVFFTAWLELFQEAGYFRETVLWMDCCMNRDRSDPSLPTMQKKVSADPPGPSFVAFAARRPLKAVERPSASGATVHGVFTTILLEGLRGAAANPYGMVTGRSLADWLRNAQRGRLDPADLADPRVSKEPEIIREDQELVFARGLPVAKYKVVLEFAGAAGMEARLWSGRPPRFEPHQIPPSGKLKLDIVPGLYVVDVPEKSLRQGFQITSPLKLKVDGLGGPVRPTTDMVAFEIAPEDPGSEIFIVDEAFSLVDRGVDRLSVKLPFGIYKVRTRLGRRLSEEVHLLDDPPAPAAAAAPLPPFTSAAPLARHRSGSRIS